METNDYLAEFRNMAHELTKITIKNFEGSDLSPEEYINSIKAQFGKDLSEKATEVLHKATINGLSDMDNLIEGVRTLNFESVMNLKNAIK